jgi:hypothetical protein
MSNAEYFLLAWAVLSTVFAVIYHGRAKSYYLQNAKTAVLLAELAFGDIKAVTNSEGYTVVENEELVMSFKKKKESENV